MARLSIEELGNIEITSVSKRPEALSEASSAIAVITRDAILQSGARTLPEILRLAPNLQVYQTSASRYAITARGHNGADGAQNFANKLLVLIDGRSVYTPLFSGVFWDMQGVLPEDIDRIEVISGPGATLWGANAVNGVINIITRHTADTQAGLVSARLGEEERGVAVRYGGSLSDSLTYRLYGRAFSIDDTTLDAGGSANDHWSNRQAGFRLDWQPGDRDAFRLQGDAYSADEAQQGAPAQPVDGANLTAGWTRSYSDGSTLQVQAYYDRARRGDEVNGVGFRVDTFDLDVQHAFPLGENHQVVVGGGYRINNTRVDNSATLLFLPADRDLQLLNLFAQDTIALDRKTTLTVGVKVEDDAYLDPEVLPTVRLAWAPSQTVTVWGAVSKAIRSATPFDRDVVERVNGRDFLIGGPDFQSEKLTAYELGARYRLGHQASMSVNAFYDAYDDLRNIEITPVTLLPLQWGNGLGGHTYGVEAWGDLQVTDRWRLSGSVVYLEEKYSFDPGASTLVGPRQVANDPHVSAQLSSQMALGRALSWHADLRYVSALPDPGVPAYLELNSRLAWTVTDRLQLGVTARNLLHDDHLEAAGGTRIPRSVYMDLRWGI